MQSAVASKKRKAAPAPSMIKRGSAYGMMGAPSEESDTESVTSSVAATRMPKIRVGNRNLTMHSELVEMRDSTPEYEAGQFDLLRARLESDGFLFVRGVMPRRTVAKAREKMLTHLHAKGAIRDGTDWTDAFIEYQHAWDEKNKTTTKKKTQKKGTATATATNSKKMIPGWTVDAETGGLVGSREPDSAIAGWHEIGNSTELTDVYNGASLRSFFQRLFEQDEEYRSRPQLASSGVPAFSTLPSCTWLRAKGPGEVTAEHVDYYYFANNTNIFGDYWRADAHEATRAKAAKCATVEERETCQICHDPRDPETTLICDLCECGYHMACLKPRVTDLPGEEQEWHCHECVNQPMNYWTCWTALGDIGGHDGRLALIPGSHRVGGYEETRAVELLPVGYTKSFESAAVWQTPTNIGMGDIILFNMKTIHAATRNAGEKFRLSLDTRVTTSKGRQYLSANGLESIDQPAKASASRQKKVPIIFGATPTTAELEAAAQNKKPKVNINTIGGSAERDTITAHFPMQKKQKV